MTLTKSFPRCRSITTFRAWLEEARAMPSQYPKSPLSSSWLSPPSGGYMLGFQQHADESRRSPKTPSNPKSPTGLCFIHSKSQRNSSNAIFHLNAWAACVFAPRCDQTCITQCITQGTMCVLRETVLAKGSGSPVPVLLRTLNLRGS